MKMELETKLLPAILTSLLSGGIASFITFVISQAFEAFAKFPLTPSPPQSTKDALLHDVGITALKLLGLAVGLLALGSLTSSLWIWTSERNVMVLRKAVYKAAAHKDMVWFDTKMGSEGNVQSADGEHSPLSAGGLMVKFTRSEHVLVSLTPL
jgi:ATP-binding cassette subfamily B (MDR/TAP) protein 1